MIIPKSEHTAWIGGQTKIVPVLQVTVICCLDQYGIAIQAPSTSGQGSNCWIIISRGPNRHVEELYHDPDSFLERREMANHTSVGRPHAIISSIVETQASKPETQSDLMNNYFENFIQIDKRKWDDILACEDVARKTLAWKVSKLVVNSVRRRDLAERETDGAVLWNSMRPKPRRTFQSEGAQAFSDS